MEKNMGWIEFDALQKSGVIVPVYDAGISNCTIGSEVEFVGKNIKIYRNVIIQGKIIIDSDVTIEDGSRIEGMGYIGEGSVIGCKIKNPQIGRHCIVYGLVTNSTLRDNVYVGNFAEISR